MMTRQILAALFVLTATTASFGDSYGAWQQIGSGQQTQKYVAYSYKTKTGTLNKQHVVFVPTDATLKNWYYFYKNEQAWRNGEKPWGRVQNTNHPAFDAKSMKWQHWENAKWNDYPQAGFCPAPKDAKSPILEIPPLPPK